MSSDVSERGGKILRTFFHFIIACYSRFNRCYVARRRLQVKLTSRTLAVEGDDVVRAAIQQKAKKCVPKKVMTVQFFFLDPSLDVSHRVAEKCFTISCFPLVSWSLAVIRNANVQHCARFKFHTTIFTITKTTATAMGEVWRSHDDDDGGESESRARQRKRVNPLQRAAAAHTTCECICQRVMYIWKILFSSSIPYSACLRGYVCDIIHDFLLTDGLNYERVFDERVKNACRILLSIFFCSF